MRSTLLLLAVALVAVAATSHAAEIHDAALNGDADRVAAILAGDASQIDARNVRNETPIHAAALGGHIEVVRVLLDGGCPIDIGDNESSTALDVAAIYGHPELAVLLLEKGADPVHSDVNGMTPLHFACYNGNADIAELLLEQGADATAATLGSSTPLHGAAFDGDADCMRLLIEHGAHVNARNAAGYTPLLSAAAGRSELSAIELLVSHGADVHDRTFDGATALMSAARAGRMDVMQFLMDTGVSTGARDDHGWTAMLTATEAGSDEVLEMLLENGADANTADALGRRVLWWACVRGNRDAAELLLEHGADVNAIEGNTQRTVLHGAALRGWEDFAELLLDAGADFSIKDDEGMTALHYAGKYGHRAVAELLESRGAAAPGMEKNYGKRPLLDRSVDDGQASMWYLGHCGWAVKTNDHLLIFDYWNGTGTDPASPCLINGHIDPTEIADENVYVFVTHEHGDHYDEIINGWEDEVDNLTYVFGFRPELTPAYRDSGYFGPDYEFVGPRETASIDGIEIRTISANDAGVGFLVEVDGLTLYHAGDHAGWADDERDGFIAEMDYLDPYVDDLDLAFVNVTGCHSHDPERLKEGNVYTLNTLRPNVLIPTHAANREYVYRRAADELAAAGVTTSVCCPSNRGDAFFYNGEAID